MQEEFDINQNLIDYFQNIKQSLESNRKDIVKQWIPYIEILKPIELQERGHLYIKVPNATCDLKVA